MICIFKNLESACENNFLIFLLYLFIFLMESVPGGTSGKEHASQCRRLKRSRFDPWVGKMPWRRAWQPTPIFLPGESHGQRSLVGYSAWGHEQSDRTEVTAHIAHISYITLIWHNMLYFWKEKHFKPTEYFEAIICCYYILPNFKMKSNSIKNRFVFTLIHCFAFIVVQG